MIDPALQGKTLHSENRVIVSSIFKRFVGERTFRLCLSVFCLSVLFVCSSVHFCGLFPPSLCRIV